MADAGPGGQTTAVVGGGLALLGLGTYVTLRRPTTEFDTLQYHFPDAVHWLQTHAIWTLPVLSAPYADNAYPSNAELLSSWLMQPAHASNLARLPPLTSGVLAVLGAALLARNLKSPAWLGALGGLVVVASPIFYLNVDTLMTDLAGAAGVIVGFALLASARGHRYPRRRVLLAGLAIGLSAGAKDTALAFAAMSLAWVVLAPPTAERRSRAAAVLLAGIALPSVVWFGRDWIALGNPLFPEGVVVAGHPLLQGTTTPYAVYKTTMLEHFARLDAGAIGVWWGGVLDQLGPTAFLSALGIIVALVAARPRRRARSRAVFPLALIALAGTALYLATPYTGGGRAGNATLITAQLRYDLVPIMVGLVLLVVVLPRWLSVVGLLGALAVDYNRRVLTATGLHHSKLATLGVLVAVQLAVMAVMVGGARRYGSWPRLTHGANEVMDRAGRLRRTVAAVVAGLVVLGGLGAVLRSAVAYPSRLPAALAGAARGGPVLELGVPNVAQLFGPHLRRRIATVGAGPDGNREPDRACSFAI